MTMTFKQRVANARNPQDALLMLAEGIDLILTQLVDLPQLGQPDPWGEWDQVPQVNYDTAPSMHAPTPEAVEVLRANLETATGETRSAIEAAIRLAEDSGKAVDTQLPDGVRDRVLIGEEGVEVFTRPVDRERATARSTFAKEIELGPDLTPVLDHQTAVEAFVKGGPAWLYVYDRDFVISMPTNWKQALVADVEQDSPREAAEMARDILKDGQGVDQQTALETLYG